MYMEHLLKLRLLQLTGVVTSIADDVEPSPVIDCEVEFKPTKMVCY